MTRRPPMPPDGNVRRAHQRMAPGGRLWSESPVKGPAVRVVAAGDDPVAPVVDAVWLGETTIAPVGTGTKNFFVSTIWDVAAGGDLQVGDMCAMAYFCYGAGREISGIPAGWVQDVLGTSGTMTYGVVHGYHDGSDRYSFVFEGNDGNDGLTEASLCQVFVCRDTGTLVPKTFGGVGTATATATSPAFVPSDSNQQNPNPPGEGWYPMQLMGFQVDAPNNDFTLDPDATSSSFGIGGYIYQNYQGGTGEEMLTGTVSAAPDTGSWVSLAVALS